MICLLFISMVCTAKVLANAGCPDDYNIFPCTCDNTGTLPVIQCRHRDINSIYRGLKFISSIKAQILSMKIQSSQTLSIHSVLFGESMVKKVTFQVPKLQSIAVDVFEGQQFFLEEVTFDQTSLTELPTYILKMLRVLKVYAVHKSKYITYIKADYFQSLLNPQTLKSIDFSDNSIRVIESGAFETLINIEVINLMSNSVLSLNADMFPSNPTRLRTITFWRNRLTSLPSQFLKRLQTGVSLDFDSNAIVNIKEDDIATIVRKRLQIDLRNNPLNCDCSFVSVALANERSGTGIATSSTCSQPSVLNGRSVTKLTMNDFQHCLK